MGKASDLLVQLLVIFAVIAVAAWLVLKLFGGGDELPSLPKNPLSQLNDLKNPLAGNPQDPGYGFFYGQQAWSWSALGDWITGKVKETFSPDPYAGQDNWSWNPGAISSNYTPGSESQLDQELQPW
jgi:hypothetical protein